MQKNLHIDSRKQQEENTSLLNNVIVVGNGFLAKAYGKFSEDLSVTISFNDTPVTVDESGSWNFESYLSEEGLALEIHAIDLQGKSEIDLLSWTRQNTYIKAGLTTLSPEILQKTQRNRTAKML
jgi:hypothetical protein